MSDLSINEFWFLRIYEKRLGFLRERIITHVEIVMMELGLYDSKSIMNSLIEKKILRLSERGQELEITKNGLEVYKTAKNIQEKWECHPISNISYTDSSQFLIKSGETFKANRIIREIFAKAEREIWILDPYIGPKLFDLLEDSNHKAEVRVVTSDRTPKGLFSSYLDYKKQYGLIEMRIVPYSDVKFHDRFIFLDESLGFHSGHSLKDLGDKDSQINLIKNPEEHIKIFNDSWANAEKV
jgi:hypothetical protein